MKNINNNEKVPTWQFYSIKTLLNQFLNTFPFDSTTDYSLTSKIYTRQLFFRIKPEQFRNLLLLRT